MMTIYNKLPRESTQKPYPFGFQSIEQPKQNLGPHSIPTHHGGVLRLKEQLQLLQITC